MKFIVLSLLFAVAMSAEVGMNQAGDAYNFHYAAGDAGGHRRDESGHGGTVSGSYSYMIPMVILELSVTQQALMALRPLETLEWTRRLLLTLLLLLLLHPRLQKYQHQHLFTLELCSLLPCRSLVTSWCT
ncbi:adult-specific rigid cuticular protein 12.6 [Trichonephila clavata]|uniref:Adult-specific rigid cuticular protein 12.6 n=1 Tax=Trichonephila clavata TaxID=2740835 RepID=A0A8X6K760_TRICU|nr:adult-specific rigid cuticular protein 12.6 [Trichonephila clavata]